MKILEPVSCLGFAALVAVAVGCLNSETEPAPVTTTSATVTRSSAANGSAPTLSVHLERIEPPSHFDTAVFLTVDHLDPPSQAAPGTTVYKVWIQPSGAKMQSLGSVVPDENGRAVLDTVAPKDQFRIMLTPESGDEVTQPTNDPVVVADVKIR